MDTQVRILVIDDEKFIVEAISQHLTALGYEILPFIDPAEALEVIKAEEIDLVLTDLRMPDISGMDITRAVHDRGSDTRVIILTGYATLDSAIESVHLQVYAYLHKPFDLRQLGQVVEQALTEQYLERENRELYETVHSLLKDMTTLHDISRLIYDTDDFDMAIEFALDTLAIGLGMTHSALILRSADGVFSPAKVNMPAGSPAEAKLAKVNWAALAERVPGPDAIKLDRENGGADILKTLSSKNEKFEAALFAPINYREELLGYFVVLQPAGGAALSSDQQILLGILATQLAPQVFQSRGPGPAPAGKGYLTNSRRILDSRIELALEKGEQRLALTLVRLAIPREWHEEDDLGAFHSAVADLVARHEQDTELHWLGADTALLIYPNATQVEADVTSMAIVTDYLHRGHDLPQGGPGEVEPQMLFASAVWPSDSESATRLLSLVWFRLMNTIQKEAARLAAADAAQDD